MRPEPQEPHFRSPWLGVFGRNLISTAARHAALALTLGSCLHLAVDGLEAAALLRPAGFLKTLSVLPSLLLIASGISGATSVAVHLRSGAELALRAGGGSAWVWVRPLGIWALATSSIAALASELAPWALRQSSSRPRTSALLVEGPWLLSETASRTWILVAQGAGRIEAIGTVEHVEHASDTWRFEGLRWLVDTPEARLPRFVGAEPEVLQGRLFAPKTLTRSELVAAGSAARWRSASRAPFLFERWSRLGHALTTGGVFLLGAVVTLLFGLELGPSLAAGAGLVLSAWVLQTIASSLAQAEALEPRLAAFGLPVATAALVTGCVLRLHQVGARSPG